MPLILNILALYKNYTLYVQLKEWLIKFKLTVARCRYISSNSSKYDTLVSRVDTFSFNSCKCSCSFWKEVRLKQVLLGWFQAHPKPRTTNIIITRKTAIVITVFAWCRAQSYT